MGVQARIRDRILREGPISFAEYMETALYDPADGFFTGGRGAGRAGRDFVTSPEVGSLFGLLVSRALDDTWRRLGRPDPFLVIEAGAGGGRLAADVLRAQPACARALRYVLVERSGPLRDAQRERLPVEPPDEALGPFLVADGETPEPQPGQGPIVTALDDLPAIRVTGVVLANELLDNLPVRLVERGAAGWFEVRVDRDDARFVEVLVPAPPALAAEADVVAAGITPEPGIRLPVPLAAREWLERVAGILARGELVCFDYVDGAASMAERGQDSWLRTYRAHQPGGSPLEAPGTKDITCDVPLEYVLTVAGRAGLRTREILTQRDWAVRNGIAELVAEGDAIWAEGARRGDLEALAGRSRGVEAAALTDPGGLGAHRVLIFER